jgi:DNA polymerase I
MSNGWGAYNRYFGRLNTGKMKIRGVMARKGDTPGYVNKMQQEVFKFLADSKSQEELQRIKPKAREVYRRHLEGIQGAWPLRLRCHLICERLQGCLLFCARG